MANKDSKTPATKPAATEKPTAADKAIAKAQKEAADKANKAELDAKAKADAAVAAAEKAKKDAEKAAAKAAKEAEKITAKAEKEAAAVKAKAEKEAARKEAQAEYDKVKAAADAAKKAEQEARAKLRGTGAGGSTKGPDALRTYASSYVKDNEHKTPSGNPSVHCGDDVAKKFLGKTLDEVYAITAKAIDEDEASLRAKYGKLNVGMQRMNLGNKLRGVLHAK